jgi:hypothetical protein
MGFGNPQVVDRASRAFNQMLKEIKEDKFQSFENYEAVNLFHTKRDADIML